MTATPLAASPGDLLYRPATGGATFFGPGDVYRFLVTGAESGGAYFAMEAYVPPGGGPPPHIHRNEDETFYIVEGADRVPLGVGDDHRAAPATSSTCYGASCTAFTTPERPRRG